MRAFFVPKKKHNVYSLEKIRITEKNNCVHMRAKSGAIVNNIQRNKGMI